ncbi:hypothetical protein [Streptococcus thoraltensis]
MTIAQVKEYIQEEQFAACSMIPKVQAAMSFVENYPQGEAVITSLENMENSLNGGTSTIVQA